MAVLLIAVNSEHGCPVNSASQNNDLNYTPFDDVA
jgi:hypothetical protein